MNMMSKQDFHLLYTKKNDRNISGEFNNTADRYHNSL